MQIPVKNPSQYLGILIAALYGLIIRFFVEQDSIIFSNNVYNISFIFITPVIIGIIPILFLKNQVYENGLKSFFYPIISVFLFIVIAVVTKLEDLFCILIIGLPFFLIAGTVGFIAGSLLKKREQKKKLLSLVFLPLIFLPIEKSFPDRTQDYKVSYSLIINKSPEYIFPNLVEVPHLTDKEYKEGFFQFIGIPRPIESKLFQKNGTQYRIGQFTDGLALYETIEKQVENQYVNYKIDLDKSQLRDRPTDNHVLKGNNFEFENIYYSLSPISSNQTKVTLSCDYRITSKMNFYANFWAKMVIKDFETRLLDAIKVKLEMQ